MTADLPAVREQHELGVTEPRAPAVLDVDYREIAVARPYGGPVDRPRSVVQPAALAALVICGGPCLAFLLVVVAR